MRMYDLLAKKKRGGILSRPELSYLVKGFTAGEIPDYQMSAMLMAICFQGMSDEEVGNLTMEMAESGEMADLSCISGFKVDKHSTGGVGDKTTLILTPIVASCGVKVAKMSGRGLGFTGGTIDKLLAIPGFQTDLPMERFFAFMNTVGAAIISQTGNLAPADKKMYALRDVTATVDSIPLIASSIMSKKLAAGSDGILLDVKCGSGAFMKTQEQARALAECMVAIGTHAGRRMSAVITDMDRPLGEAIGNALEVAEALAILHGKGPADLREISLELSAGMLELAGKGDHAACLQMAREALDSGRALQKVADMVTAQGGDLQLVFHPERLQQAKHRVSLYAPESGYVAQMDTEGCGIASMMLGAGRQKKEDVLDLGAGILLHCRTGDAVKKGDVLATLCTDREELLEDASRKLLECYTITADAPKCTPLILDRVDKSRCDENR